MNIKEFFKKYSNYLLAIVIFIVLAFAYCSPVLEGKVINQHDVLTAKGQQGEINQYREKEDKTPLWTNSMFGGMPSYLILMGENGNTNVFRTFNKISRLGLPTQSVDIIFLYMIGFFVLALAFGVNFWLAILGTIAFTFSSYNIIYIGAGHINKALAMGMMAPILAGLVFTSKGRYLLGGVIFCCSLGMQLTYNHLQITYYTLLMVLSWGAYNLVYSIKEKRIKNFAAIVSVITVASVISILPNLIQILPTYEYMEVTSRSGSELNVNEKGEKESGLSKDYAFAWSYSPSETFTLLVPNFKGGSTVSSLSEKSHLYKALKKNNVPQAKQYIKQVYTYWGVKGSTQGPFYFGAVVIFLFVLGMFALPGKQKWWVFTISVLAILWSWGENFYTFSSISFDYIPMFNKFRVPENFLVIPSLMLPLIGVLVLHYLISGEYDKKKFVKQLQYSGYITGGLLVLLILISGSFDYTSELDAAYGKLPGWFVSALHEDRARLLKLDAFRSLVFIGIAFGAIWFYIKGKLKLQYLYIALIATILIDLWGVDRRYLNTDNFDTPKKAKEYKPTQADLQILQDPDPHYRVFNVSDPFRESKTSYFHKSIGGYHAAKIARYDDIIKYHLSKNNMNVVNMLNTKYFMIPNEQGQEMVQRNPNALGNAWYVNDIKWEESAKEESDALYTFQPSQTAIVNSKYQDYFEGKPIADSGVKHISLTSYHPEKLEYKTNSDADGFVVFSEIYYNDTRGWNAYIDGEKVPHIQVDYILRGMFVPKGEHDIVYKFEPQIVQKARLISRTGSAIVLLLIAATIGMGIVQGRKKAVA